MDRLREGNQKVVQDLCYFLVDREQGEEGFVVLSFWSVFSFDVSFVLQSEMKRGKNTNDLNFGLMIDLSVSWRSFWRVLTSINKNKRDGKGRE